MFQLTLEQAAEALLSIRSTLLEHSKALGRLERVMSSIVDDNSARLDAFRQSQNCVATNLTAVLLESIGRTIAAQELASSTPDPDLLRSNLTRSLNLLQGLVLLHTPSRDLFARRSSLEYLLAVLDLSRPSHVASPLLASAPSGSPVVMPPPPTPSSARKRALSLQPSSPAAVSVATLDCLLAALVDSPKNVRAFESLDGLSTIVRVLKDKTVAQQVRIKVIEILYFYLLPESGATSALTSPSFASAGDFVPQTPIKARPPSRFTVTTETRSASEKRELLAQVMPNVEALEERFRAMGLAV
ncbi:hypothetical protein OIV83_006065 [Microbotryomycetes sp. JL201]|nr:hypothetical protein OIV83_006065 [Microbotryomycetes sp. JL201]